MPGVTVRLVDEFDTDVFAVVTNASGDYAGPEEILRQGEGPALVAPLHHRDIEPGLGEIGAAGQAVDAGSDHDHVEILLHSLAPPPALGWGAGPK